MSTPEVFGRTRLLVEPALRAVVEGLSARLRPSSTYHFGWTEADGSPSDMGAGKGLRLTLAVLSAEAVGAPAEEAGKTKGEGGGNPVHGSDLRR